MFYTAIRSARTGRLQPDSLQTYSSRMERNAYLAQNPAAVPLSREEALSAFGTATLSAHERPVIATICDPDLTYDPEDNPSTLTNDPPTQAPNNPHMPFKPHLPSFQGFKRK